MQRYRSSNAEGDRRGFSHYTSQHYDRDNREMGSPHRSPPRLLDGDSKGMKDRLQDINYAMSWIKDELVSHGASIALDLRLVGVLESV